MREEVMKLCEDILYFLARAPQLAQEFTMEELETNQEMVPRDLHRQIFELNQDLADQNVKTFTTYGCRSLKLT